MPYPGVPANLTDKMERCVRDVMADGKSKSSAIAICHSRIVGNKKKPTKKSESNLKGGDNMKKQQTDETKTEEVKTEVEETKDETTTEGDGGTETTTTEESTTETETTTEEKPETETTETTTETETTETSTEGTETETGEAIEKETEAEKAAGKKNKTSDHGKDGHVCDSSCKFYQKPQKKVDGGKEETSNNEDETHISLRMDKVEALLEKAATQIAALAEAQSKKSEAPAEGATEKKDTPKEEAEKTEKVDEADKEEVAEKTEKVDDSKSETTEESTQKSETSDTSSEGASDLKKILDSFKEELKAEFDKKLEGIAAPSKAVVYSKAFGDTATVEDASSELTKINERLAEIQKIKNERPAEYNNSLTDEAFKLINKKDAIENGKAV